MKKNILIITLIMFSLKLQAQQHNINDIAKVDLDNSIEKITPAQATDHLNSKFKNNKLDKNRYVGSQHLYRYKNILVEFFAANIVTDDNTPNTQLKQIESLAPGNKNFSHEIRKTDNGTILITYNSASGMDYYHFYYYNREHTKRLIGDFDLNSEDRQEGKALLERILKGVKFTE